MRPYDAVNGDIDNHSQKVKKLRAVLKSVIASLSNGLNLSL